MQHRRLGHAEADYAAAEAEREQAEQLLDAHQHRIADLEADLVRLNEQLEQLEQTRQALRDARKQTARLQRAFNQAAGAIKKRRDAEEQRLSTLGH